MTVAATFPLIALSFLAAGFVKGVIGLGLPTVSMGLLALVLAPAEAAALLIVPSLVTNIWQMAAGASLMPLVRRLWPMMLAVTLGTWATSSLIAGEAGGAASVGLGLSITAYALYGLLARPLAVPERSEAWLSPLVGAVTGLITGATGTFVIPVVPYLQTLVPDKDDLIQALGLSFTVSTLALAVALWRFGVIDGRIGTWSLLAVLPAVLGMRAGQSLRGRISTIAFRRWFFIGLLAVGAHLALRPLL